MSQCVPGWDLDSDNHRLSNTDSHSNTIPQHISTLDYEVSELTWKNGQLAMNSLGQPRVPMKTFTSTTKWDVNPLAAGGTLESIVHLATSVNTGDEVLIPWFEKQRAVAAAVTKGGQGGMSGSLTMDALVPSTNPPQCVGDSSAHVGSCSRGPPPPNKKGLGVARNRGRVARVERAARVPSIGTTQDWSTRDLSLSVNETFNQDDSRCVTADRDYALGFTSPSADSPGNTSSGVPCKTSTGDDNDSVCHSRRQRQIVNEDESKNGNRKSTKRSRAAAVHNQSERKRRDKINQRMKTLQKMVPNSSKIDKASMLDEVIEYLKQLQAQVNMMGRMNMSPAMMLPLAMQQQMQMSMMAPMMGMGMGMGVGMGMDMNTMAAARHNMSGISPAMQYPNSFMQGLPSWDASGADRAQPAAMPDPSSSFIGSRSQPMMTIDAYSQMAAMYQHMHQPHG